MLNNGARPALNVLWAPPTPIFYHRWLLLRRLQQKSLIDVKKIAPFDELIPKLFAGFTPAAAFVRILHITVKDPNQAAA
jgi:hypothetical protein